MQTCSRAQDQSSWNIEACFDTQKCINMEIVVGHQVSGIKNIHEKYLEPHKSKHQAKREEKEKEMAPPPPNWPGQGWDGSPTGLWLSLASPVHVFLLEFAFHYSTTSAKSPDTVTMIQLGTPACTIGAMSFLLRPIEASSCATFLRSRETCEILTELELSAKRTLSSWMMPPTLVSLKSSPCMAQTTCWALVSRMKWLAPMDRTATGTGTGPAFCPGSKPLVVPSGEPGLRDRD